MASRGDSKGYYAALGLQPGASADSIKKAYRAKAMELHPDRNPAPNAKEQFQFLNEAYSILKDETSRTQYDAQTYAQAEQPSNQPPEPAICSICKKQSAQLRYAAFRRVLSLIYVCQTSFEQGLFCPDCGTKTAIKQSLFTWLLGWWSLWGLIYAPWALLINMAGGQQPPLNNARLLAYQAWCYAVIGKTQVAKAIARDALRFASKVAQGRDPTEREEGERLLAGIGDLLRHLHDGAPTPTFVKKWGLGSRMFYIQASGAAAIVTVVAIWMGASSNSEASTHTDATPYQPTQSYSYTPPPVPAFTEAARPLPSTGVFKEYFDPNAQFALGPMRFDTQMGGPNYYVKIVDWNTSSVVLTGFIRSGQSLSVHIPVGTYRLKFAAGDIWYGSKYRFGPSTAYSVAADSFDIEIEGNQVAGYTVTLYKQLNGNLHVNDINADDF